MHDLMSDGIDSNHDAKAWNAYFCNIFFSSIIDKPIIIFDVL